ncbi:TfpX/TfpZ family type IV pilin accessory protein [Acinetobacter ursingii]|uniref:TfpX/TfpZ family type IV pilin accessory protein n=1 Tax=Acinetobacter ursingii TaxID=108980 RepID=UPI003AF6AC4F
MTPRIKFFLVHIITSVIIASLLILLVFCIWYPYPLTKAIGVTDIFLMMLLIDVIIGPLLGLLIYNQAKKSLKIDLFIIILLQSSALGYGIYSIEQGRPIWIVYVVDIFELVRKNDIIDSNIEKASPQYQYPSWLKPNYVMAKRAKTIEEKNDDLFAAILDNISIAQRPERYVKIALAKIQIQQQALHLKELEKYNPKIEVEQTLAKYPNADAWLPLKATAVDMVVLINKESASIIKIVDLRPWE